MQKREQLQELEKEGKIIETYVYHLTLSTIQLATSMYQICQERHKLNKMID